MTAREIWEGMLTELSKVNAPSLLLQDFNYFFNKAINQYINKRYNIYDINQLTTDDLRVLKSTAVLDVKQATSYGPLSDLTNYKAGKSKLFGAIFEVTLPSDYLHMLNCICIYKIGSRYKCYDKDDYVQFAAKRLTADSWSIIVNDYYNRPLPERPYYYIHNVNKYTDYPYDAINRNNYGGTDLAGVIDYDAVTDTSGEEAECLFPRTIELNNNVSLGIAGEISRINREAGFRYGNPNSVRMEIRYGSDSSVFKLEKVFIDYIKAPQVIRLTLELVNLTLDTSQVMEFPDYVCQEIINELTMLVMENTADPRLQSNVQVTQSIAHPAQQLAAQPTQLAQ